MNYETQSQLLSQIHKVLREKTTHSPEKAKMFFRTGDGCYAAHDQFIGISVPELRLIAKKFSALNLEGITVLLQSDFNEERLLALFILIKQYDNASIEFKDVIANFYLRQIRYVNNWNLVDSSAQYILGPYLWNKDKTLLIQLAQSSNLWERRISIVTTLHFIRKNDLLWTFNIAFLLLNDQQDLIHKSVGWMLRECGKKDRQALSDFLDKHASHMPRTMLRYAIEKFSKEERMFFMRKKFNENLY
jgi:3-methyladenine DNA glycosylase AlkD